MSQFYTFCKLSKIHVHRLQQNLAPMQIEHNKNKHPLNVQPRSIYIRTVLLLLHWFWLCNTDLKVDHNASTLQVTIEFSINSLFDVYLDF